MAETVVTAGIDVSKEWLDCAVWPGKAELRVERNAVGFDQLAAWLVEHRVSRVGLEASGGYETVVMDALQARGFAVIRFTPNASACSPRRKAGWPRTTGRTHG